MTLKVILFISLLLPTYAYSQVSRNFNKKDKPIYEIGLGVVSLTVPNYPGSKSTTERTIPFPWVIYRGDVLKADEEGSRLKLIGSDRFEVGFSGGFNFPIKSSQNEARKGMPDTNALIGLGPGLLYRVPLVSKLHRLTLGLGMRVNFSTTTSLTEIKIQGYIIEPNVRYWLKPTEKSPVTFFGSLSYSASDEKYAEFFYEVAPRYVTATRQAHKAVAGTVDIATSLGLSWEATKTLTVFTGIFYSNLSLAANKKSDLLEDEHNRGFVLGASWMIAEKYL